MPWRLQPHATLARKHRMEVDAYVVTYREWCERNDYPPLRPTSMLTYLRHNTTLPEEYRHRRATAIRRYIAENSPSDPFADVALLEAVRELVGVALPRFTPAEIRRFFESFDKGMLDVRDKAMFLLVYVARLSERDLVRLQVDGVSAGNRYMRLRCGNLVRTIWRCRDTAYCPVRALEGWLAMHPAGRGALFVSIKHGIKPLPRRSIVYFFRDHKRVARIRRARVAIAGLYRAPLIPQVQQPRIRGIAERGVWRSSNAVHPRRWRSLRRVVTKRAGLVDMSELPSRNGFLIAFHGSAAAFVDALARQSGVSRATALRASLNLAASMAEARVATQGRRQKCRQRPSSQFRP